MKPEERRCAGCGKLFQPRRSDTRTCSATCRTRLHYRRKVEQAVIKELELRGQK
jgi:hypothetical protein